MKSQRNQRCLKFPFTYSEIYAYVFLTRQQWFYGTFKTDEQIIFLITRFRAIIEWCRLNTFNLTQRGMIKIDGKNDSRMKTTQWKLYFILIKWECIIAYWIAYRLNNNFYWYLIMILQSMKCLKIFGKIIIPLRFISKICGDFYRDKIMIDEVNITYSSIIYFFLWELSFLFLF